MSSPPIRFVTTADGVTIAACTAGTGPTLLYVRGWVSHLELLWEEESFRRFFEPISRHRCLVRYDMRGNGLSDRRAELTLDGFVADIEAVVEGLGIDRLELLGTTYGGPVAATYAARHPDRVDRLILEGTFARGADVVDQSGRERILALAELFGVQPAAGAALSYLTSPELTGSHGERIRRVRRSIDPGTLRSLYELAFELDVSEELRSVQCPTLVLHRRRETAIPLAAGRRVAALVPGAEFVALEGSAANLWEQDTGGALTAVAAFLGLPESIVPARAARSTPPRTVVFTDLVGSTALTSALGDRAAQQLLHEHDALVRNVLAAWGGREVKHTGDGIMASFPSVSGALRAASGLQLALGERNAGASSMPALVVRVGINTGEPLEEGDDLYGTVVQLAARLCAAAEPGQVLVSNVVRELAAGKGFHFDDLGEGTLKGFPEPVRRYALVPES
jgi:class 3 adenylate cyclase